MKLILQCLLTVAASLACAQASLAAQVSATPSLPTHGQNVTVELRDTRWPAYLPATRYVRVGGTIVIDYEYAAHDLAAPRADFGQAVLDLGELVPGSYTLEARLFRMDDPGGVPEVFSRTLTIAQPERWGIYVSPGEPQAFAPIDVMIRSAVYFEPGSMQATVNGNVIRVDFDYRGDAPVGGPMPPGTTAFAALRLASLAPGGYVVEGWGRKKSGGIAERYFTQPFTVASSVAVIEFYAEALDHYLHAPPGDIALLDGGSMGAWKRTGQQFKAWLRMGDGPADAGPICRFRSPSSSFYTGDPGECEYLKALELQQRGEPHAKAFTGWAYEGIAFYAFMPEDGGCPRGTIPVHRSYNDRAEHGDSNHRFTADLLQRAAMAMAWIDEGIAFCSPS